MRPIEVKKLNLHYKYYIKRGKTKKKEKIFKVNIKVPIIRSSHKNSNREGTKSFFHHLCPVLPEQSRSTSQWCTLGNVPDG
jgi:hypothetical protein